MHEKVMWNKYWSEVEKRMSTCVLNSNAIINSGSGNMNTVVETVNEI